jgi:hypothetical protein
LTGKFAVLGKVGISDLGISMTMYVKFIPHFSLLFYCGLAGLVLLLLLGWVIPIDTESLTLFIPTAMCGLFTYVLRSNYFL